jgi:hypothetical protein
LSKLIVNVKIVVIAIFVFGGCSVHQKWDVFRFTSVQYEGWMGFLKTSLTSLFIVVP